jgi:hypothetical protein
MGVVYAGAGKLKKAKWLPPKETAASEEDPLTDSAAVDLNFTTT